MADVASRSQEAGKTEEWKADISLQNVMEMNGIQDEKELMNTIAQHVKMCYMATPVVSCFNGTVHEVAEIDCIENKNQWEE